MLKRSWHLTPQKKLFLRLLLLTRAIAITKFIAAWISGSSAMLY
nr:hypothetical protein [Pleurocapsa sp. FMAR1]